MNKKIDAAMSPPPLQRELTGEERNLLERQLEGAIRSMQDERMYSTSIDFPANALGHTALDELEKQFIFVRRS